MSSKQTSDGIFRFPIWHGIYCLPLNIPEQLLWQHLFEKPEDAGNHCISTYFLFTYQFCVWLRSDPFFWQNWCSGHNSGIDLVVALKYTFFQLCSNAEQIFLRLARYRRSSVKHPVNLTSQTSYTALQSGHIPFFCNCFPRW